MSNLNQIKRPVITEKSTANAQFNKYVFEVDMKATKKDLKVKVFKGVRGMRSETKRITVTLKQGNTIDLGAAVK